MDVLTRDHWRQRPVSFLVGRLAGGGGTSSRSTGPFRAMRREQASLSLSLSPSLSFSSSRSLSVSVSVSVSLSLPFP